MQNHDQLRFIFGHWTHEEMVKILGKRCILFTGLREPVARSAFISLINYQSRLSVLQGKENVKVAESLNRLGSARVQSDVLDPHRAFPEPGQAKRAAPADRGLSGC